MFARPDAPLPRFEWAFIRTVLEHRGVLRDAAEAEFNAALEVLGRYDQQRADNPGGGAWEPILDDERWGAFPLAAWQGWYVPGGSVDGGRGGFRTLGPGVGGVSEGRSPSGGRAGHQVGGFQASDGSRDPDSKARSTNNGRAG